MGFVKFETGLMQFKFKSKLNIWKLFIMFLNYITLLILQKNIIKAYRQ